MRMQDKMLKICYLSDNQVRLQNARRILEEMELGNVIYTDNNRFQTKSVEYKFVNCRNPNNYMGIYGDYADCNRSDGVSAFWKVG